MENILPVRHTGEFCLAEEWGDDGGAEVTMVRINPDFPDTDSPEEIRDLKFRHVRMRVRMLFAC